MYMKYELQNVLYIFINIDINKPCFPMIAYYCTGALLHFQWKAL